MTSCCSAKPRPQNRASEGDTTLGALPVAVIGGGPVGLAAAAHLLERGLEPVILEAGPSVGTAPLAWGHVPMFSPWRYNIDRAAQALLERHGWTAPDADGFPTGRELSERYLAPLAALPEMADRLRLNTRVTGVARQRVGKVRDAGREEQPFEVRFQADGREGRLLARAVIVATGTWGNPSPAGASGLPAIGERDAADCIRHGMPDVLGADHGRYAGKRVLVVGSGHSAIGTLLDLARLAEQVPGTAILWAARNTDLTRAYGGGAADQLPERGALGQRLRRLVEAGAVELLAPFAVDEIRRCAGGSLRVMSLEGSTAEADEMVVATGLRPDLGILDEVRLDLDPALECPRVLAPLIDPNLHSCGTVRPHGAFELQQPDGGLFLAGMASYGRAPTFLLATGHEQVRSIAAFLAGDLEAARRVELDLPETGVCSSSRVLPGAADADAVSPCCAPKAPPVACCSPQPVAAKDTPCCGTDAGRATAPAEPAE
ncbi:FAD-dependent oxidoreductase [Roseomonas mucosa]|uniref:FAD-dependent oxidoreductase n=1 Tax=Roseomonas mucosa TaxID=207340 RepID=UPI001238EB8D|nr:FAD-dependent oxidoreductase [Roseomonas mucosa]MBS5905188.1 NAD(P)-binding domain-containing protein [Acetobacteraceae bacterium]MDT8312683.1 NAD(P)-binding domain-containing protein [Roseomonas mucosa]MDT8351229.1 NAD(P)-binding domain-containing protein [Roseomonas mucosa]MDT8360164.1 NAD(P)-binding domain-containing protein [Roseomonas mucosa]QET92893.1 SidA/IucD/PvdA family monooxygenase [Roseomonas mucosa]